LWDSYDHKEREKGKGYEGCDAVPVCGDADAMVLVVLFEELSEENVKIGP